MQCVYEIDDCTRALTNIGAKFVLIAHIVNWHVFLGTTATSIGNQNVLHFFASAEASLFLWLIGRVFLAGRIMY